jgi:hypothetical protein
MDYMSPYINSSQVFKIVSVFYFIFARERLKRYFLITNASPRPPTGQQHCVAGNILPSGYGLRGPVLAGVCRYGAVLHQQARTADATPGPQLYCFRYLTVIINLTKNVSDAR